MIYLKAIVRKKTTKEPIKHSQFAIFAHCTCIMKTKYKNIFPAKYKLLKKMLEILFSKYFCLKK